MSKRFEPSVGWVVSCDWPGCEKEFVVGGNVAQTATHFQCGSHHGIIPQKDRPEFQVPKGTEVNEDLITSDKDNTNE